LNGFDPVLAVLDANGQGLCSDDEATAKNYAANLPTTGNVPASTLSSQVSFNQTSGSTFADVSLVVGGYGNTAGEFLLILEGMAVTSGDGAGDSFDVNITPGMQASGVPLTIYMITRGQSGVDPLLFLSDSDLNMLSNDNGVPYSCDDAGDSTLCYSPMDLTNSTVKIATGTLPTWSQDAVLSLPVSGIPLNSDRTQNYLTFVMTSYLQQTEGQYLLAFHFGTTDNVGSGGGLSGGEQQSSNNNGNNGNGSQQQTQTGLNGNAFGVSVTCEDGSTFDNGIEISLADMRSGFTYTATAIGIDGFDPVLAVLDSDTGEGLCSDDSTDASNYAANLPTTGNVTASSTSSQVVFNQQSGNQFADISLVVGGYGNTSGEFIIILEGVSAEADDQGGDVINVNITQGMIDSGTPITTYMIAATTSLDPAIQAVDSDLNVVNDGNGTPITCDDAGDDDLCWGNSTNLSNSSVTLGGTRIPGGDYDAMLTEGLSNITISDDRTQNYFSYNLGASTAVDPTEGDYILVLHLGQSG
jgi:hypothetical protein